MKYYAIQLFRVIMAGDENAGKQQNHYGSPAGCCAGAQWNCCDHDCSLCLSHSAHSFLFRSLASYQTLWNYFLLTDVAAPAPC